MRINHKIYKIIDTLPHTVATVAVAAIIDVDRGEFELAEPLAI